MEQSLKVTVILFVGDTRIGIDILSVTRLTTTGTGTSDSCDNCWKAFNFQNIQKDRAGNFGGKKAAGFPVQLGTENTPSVRPTTTFQAARQCSS
jgi:hypothetical protein